MDFTRQPIIETVITAKEGCKLVVRSSKGAGQEEYFVDAVEVVSFGNSFFFRSLEKPKSFLVPASDYEILEVREARMVLKNVGFERSIKIGGGKESAPKPAKEVEKAKPEVSAASPLASDESNAAETPLKPVDKKRDRRKSFRRRRRGEEGAEVERTEADINLIPPPPIEGVAVPGIMRNGLKKSEELEVTSNVLKSLLAPPTNLISDTIGKYKDNKLFEGVFVNPEKRQKEEHQVLEDENLEISEEAEKGIFEHRHYHDSQDEIEEPFIEESFSGSVFSEDFPGHGDEDEDPFVTPRFDEENPLHPEEEEEKDH